MSLRLTNPTESKGEDMAEKKAMSRAEMAKMLDRKDASIRKALLSSYGLMTAEKIMKKLGVKITTDLLKWHIKDGTTFYYRLLRLPALLIFNELVYSQVQDKQTFAQQKMIHYLYSDEAHKGPDEPGAAYREQMESIRLSLVEINNQFREITEQCDGLEKSILTELKKEAKAWAAKCQSISTDVMQQLKENGTNLPKQFGLDLSNLLAHQAVYVRFTPELMKEYQLDKSANMVEKAVSHTLHRAQAKEETT